MKRTMSMFVAWLVVFFAYSGMAQAAPSLINYQGRLFEDGEAVSGVKDMTFTIYDEDGEVYSQVDENVQTIESVPVSLAHQHLVPGTEVVTSLSGSTLYANGVDYMINYVAGQITWIPPGSPEVLVDYDWRNLGVSSWTETQAGVTVDLGLYSVSLRGVTPLPAPGLTALTAVRSRFLAPRSLSFRSAGLRGPFWRGTRW